MSRMNASDRCRSGATPGLARRGHEVAVAAREHQDVARLEADGGPVQQPTPARSARDDVKRQHLLRIGQQNRRQLLAVRHSGDPRFGGIDHEEGRPAQANRPQQVGQGIAGRGAGPRLDAATREQDVRSWWVEVRSRNHSLGRIAKGADHEHHHDTHRHDTNRHRYHRLAAGAAPAASRSATSNRPPGTGSPRAGRSGTTTSCPGWPRWVPRCWMPRACAPTRTCWTSPPARASRD